MKWMILALGNALTACGASPPPANRPIATSVAPRDVSFASYRTFAFGLADAPRRGYAVTPRSLAVQSRLRGIVQSALQERGLREAADASDIVVKLAAGSGSAPNPAPERGMAPATGFIGINIYDGASGTQVWQGSAFAEIDPNEIDDTLLQLGVDHMLEGFASRGGRGVAEPH